MPFYSRDSLRNRRPEWVDENDPLFITLCHKRRGIHHFDNPDAWRALLASAKHAKDTDRWHPMLVLAMPDHLHIIAKIRRNPDITRMLGELKRDYSHRLPTEWQKGGFDHRLRSYEHYLEKRDYVLLNPVRAGFILKPADWPYSAWWDTKGYDRPEGVREYFGN
jgi:REP element-mobilizing transposase RayT